MKPIIPALLIVTLAFTGCTNENNVDADDSLPIGTSNNTPDNSTAVKQSEANKTEGQNSNHPGAWHNESFEFSFSKHPSGGLGKSCFYVDSDDNQPHTIIASDLVATWDATTNENMMKWKIYIDGNKTAESEFDTSPLHYQRGPLPEAKETSTGISSDGSEFTTGPTSIFCIDPDSIIVVDQTVSIEVSLLVQGNVTLSD